MVARDARGLIYQPSAVPQADKELRGYVERELQRISDALKQGRVQWMTLDVQSALPEQPVQAMVMYFRAGVAGATEGAYEYRGSSWQKL